MDRREELVAIAMRKYKDEQVIKPLPGGFKWQYGEQQKSDNSYSFAAFKEQFTYNKEEDTLCNWGRGLGLIYRKGVWAGDTEINYEIY